MKYFNRFIDKKVLNNFIVEGNTLRMDFTEKEFLNYRRNVMHWLASEYERIGNLELAGTFLVKSIDIIDLDGNVAHIEKNMNNKDLHSFRKGQLAAILLQLDHFQKRKDLYWTNVRSWLAIGISIISLFVSIITLFVTKIL